MSLLDDANATAQLRHDLRTSQAKGRATRKELDSALAVIATLSERLRAAEFHLGDGHPEPLRDVLARTYRGLPLSEAVDLNLKTGDGFDGRSEEGAVECVEMRHGGDFTIGAGSRPEHVVGVDNGSAESVSDGRGCGHDSHLSSGDSDATARPAGGAA